MKTYRLVPGSVAALLYVHGGHLDPTQPAIFMNNETGVVYGPGAIPPSLNQSGLPLEVQTEINKYFEHVFSLEHETWKGPGPSPRAQYVDTAVPWTVEYDDWAERICDAYDKAKFS